MDVFELSLCETCSLHFIITFAGLFIFEPAAWHTEGESLRGNTILCCCFIFSALCPGVNSHLLSGFCRGMNKRVRGVFLSCCIQIHSSHHFLSHFRNLYCLLPVLCEEVPVWFHCNWSLFARGKGYFTCLLLLSSIVKSRANTQPHLKVMQDWKGQI